MNLVELRNTLREFYRAKVQAGSAALQALDLVVANEGSDKGDDELWQRLNIQTGEAAVTGVGTDIKRRTRVGRVFVEVFGPKGVGDGKVSELVTEAEQIWRDAMVAANSPDPLIYIGEPSSFERPEERRYCQVVSVPFRADLLS
jgi:hypothetical protein